MAICLTWNQITFTLVHVFHRRLQVFKNKYKVCCNILTKTRKKKQRAHVLIIYKNTDSSSVPTFSLLDFAPNTNFIIKLFDKFWQYASIWKKLFNIFHFHSSLQTCYVCSRVYFVHFIMATWKRCVKLLSFRLFLFLNIRLFRVMIILRCLKD